MFLQRNRQDNFWRFRWVGKRKYPEQSAGMCIQDRDTRIYSIKQVLKRSKAEYHLQDFLKVQISGMLKRLKQEQQEQSAKTQR